MWPAPVADQAATATCGKAAPGPTVLAAHQGALSRVGVCPICGEKMPYANTAQPAFRLGRNTRHTAPERDEIGRLPPVSGRSWAQESRFAGSFTAGRGRVWRARGGLRRNVATVGAATDGLELSAVMAVGDRARGAPTIHRAPVPCYVAAQPRPGRDPRLAGV